ncbi:uncharacterized protein [Primulina eburnea]|uniref:uncharacterized protein isoform X1 n=1 Tax=Primulina eburnea TaxID=1245227 RepID=UPI003C6CC31E
MEGLIKGLINVALDRIDGGGGDQNERDEERSRSTWAEVVSGDQQPHQNSGFSAHSDVGHTQQEAYGRTGGSEHSRGSRAKTRYGQEGDDESNDGWETVPKRSSKLHHQVHKDQWDNYKRPLDEQDYSGGVDCSVDVEPSQDELADLSMALQKLWELDSNRLVPGKDYQIDCGEGKKVYQSGDMTEGSLFSWLSEETFKRPTFSRFCSLLDNYNPHEGYKEDITPQEKQEQAAFIEEISRTGPIKYLHKYLSAKGVAPENYQDFKRMLTSLWFDLYGRGGTSGSSSAFEHVFVGEIKQRGEQEVSGFHNWIQFYLEEAKGRVDYQGYIFPRRRGQLPDSETQLLTIQFEWNGVLKSVSSTLVGVSPEFEVAIYTLCFYLGGEDNHVELGPYLVNIKCYRLGNRIGSVFPIADC